MSESDEKESEGSAWCVTHGSEGDPMVFRCLAWLFDPEVPASPECEWVERPSVASPTPEQSE